MTAPVPDPLPYGIRQIMLTPYLDVQGTMLSTQSYPLPVAMTLGFSETEQFDELRGDDKLVAVHGRGPQVDWSLESGGMNMVAWSIITGGSVVESGVAPNRQVALQKSWDDERPYFRIDGRIISDSGGNVVARIYRAKANGKIQANHKNGAFQTSQIDGIGLPLVNDDASWLYEIVQNETDSPLSGTPTPNPVPIPTNVYVGVITNTTVALSWTDIIEASQYLVQQSIDGGVTWTAVPAGTNAVQTVTLANATGGTFTLTFGGQTTVPIAYNASAATVQSALMALSSIGANNVVVSLTGSVYTVTFDDALGDAAQTLMTDSATGLTGSSPTITIATATAGTSGGGQPTEPFTTITGLTANTHYQFQVAAVVNSVTGEYCTPVLALTT
jgi:hypothetical protein